jgi:hypothetical protein
MPATKEAGDQENVRHLHLHGDKGGEGMECVETPDLCRCDGIGNGKHEQVDPSQRPIEELPAEISHVCGERNDGRLLYLG